MKGPYFRGPSMACATFLAAASLLACSTGHGNGSGPNNAGGSGPATGAGGTAGSTGTGGDGDASMTGSPVVDGASIPGMPSSMPKPPVSGVAKPTGAPGNLTVVSWAGFKAAVTYTLDDSQPSQIEHWAELKAEGVRMTFYLNSSGSAYPGYDATWKDVVAQGGELGNHTVNHCHADGSGCNNYLGSVDQEIDQCSTYIQTKLNQPTVWTFAFPFGDTGWEVPATSRFFLARGVATGLVGPNDNTDPLNLPINAAVGGEAASVFSGDIDNAHTQGRWVIFLFHSITPTANNWYAGVDIGSITGSIDHAKSLGDVWIDSLVNIGAYWRAQKVFSAVTPTTSGSSKTWTWSLPAHFPVGQYLRVTVDGGTLTQGTVPLTWDDHGYYEVALDAGTLTLSP